MDYLPIIGLEVHVEPTTKSKMFCSCNANHFGKPANTQTCPVCLGLPGALPVPNKAAIEACLKLGLALDCKINLRSKFDRKNYFYPDLPKGYQISQYDVPFCYGGSMSFQRIASNASRRRESMGGNTSEVKKLTQRTGKKSTMGPRLRGDDNVVHITRVHMEEDTGKLQHGKVNGEEVSLVDYNRSGVPLIEIVTEPDLHSAEEMKIFLKELVRLIRWLDISDCDMEKGTLRLEANISVCVIPTEVEGSPDAVQNSGISRGISVRQPTDGSPARNDIPLPPYKVEIKNVNSFRFLEKAVEYEIKRQTEILQQGEVPKQETRGFDENKSVTFSQRSKETAQDYRYFPEPDIPPLLLTEVYIEKLRKSLPEGPLKAHQRLVDHFKVREDYAAILTQDMQTLVSFESLISQLPNDISPAEAAKQIVNQKWDLITTPIEQMTDRIKASQKSYSVDEEEITKIVNEVIANNPKAVEEYKAGKVTVLGFLIGQVAKQTKGQADPQIVQKVLMDALKG